MNNQVVITKPKTMEYNTPIGIVIGFAIDLLRRFPTNSLEWGRKVVCAIGAAFIVAPFLITSLEFFSNFYPALGFVNPTVNKTVEPLVYVLTILSAEPIFIFLTRFIEVTLPNWISRRFNGDTEQES